MATEIHRDKTVAVIFFPMLVLSPFLMDTRSISRFSITCTPPFFTTYTTKAVVSIHSLYVPGQPAPVKESFTGSIQAQVDKPPLSRARLHPVKLVDSVW